MARAHYLLRLSFAAIWSSPQRPLITRTNRVHRIPEFSGDPGVRRVLQHAHALAVFDLPPNLCSELKVIPLVVDRPRPVRLKEDRVIRRSDELFHGERLLAGKD